jgi:hypothetical protein
LFDWGWFFCLRLFIFFLKKISSLLFSSSHLSLSLPLSLLRHQLFHAAKCGRAELVKLLASAGASVDCATHMGTTPLHAAAERGDLTTLTTLLRRGADPRRPSANGTTVGSTRNHARTHTQTHLCSEYN